MSLALQICFLLNAALLVKGQCIDVANYQSSGTITSPLYPGGYGDDQNCEWTITSQSQTNVVIKIDVTDILLHTNFFNVKTCTGKLTINEGEINCLTNRFCNIYYDATSSKCNKTTIYDDNKCTRIPITKMPFVLKFTSSPHWSVFFRTQRFKLDYAIMDCPDPDDTTTFGATATTVITTTSESQDDSNTTNDVGGTTISATNTQQTTETTTYVGGVLGTTGQSQPAAQQSSSNTLQIALPLILIVLVLIVLTVIILLKRRKRDKPDIYVLRDLQKQNAMKDIENANGAHDNNDDDTGVSAGDNRTHDKAKLILQVKTEDNGEYSGGVADGKYNGTSNKMADGGKMEASLHGITANGNRDEVETSVADVKSEDEYATVDKSKKKKKGGKVEEAVAISNTVETEADLSNVATQSDSQTPDKADGEIVGSIENMEDGKMGESSDYQEPSVVYATVKKS